ncbi:HEAT repeat domain-containing protein [candidate division KSB1 bacterium]
MPEFDFVNSFNLSEKILVFSIVILLLLVLILFLYTIYLRVYLNLKEKRDSRKKLQWEITILEFLSGDIDEKDISISVKQKDFILFGNFIEDYLINISGEDYENIMKFLKTRVWYGEILLKALKRGKKWEKAYAAHFLGLMKYARADDELLNLMYDKSPIVYLSAYEAIHHISSKTQLYKILRTFLSIKNISNTKMIEIIMGYGSSILPELEKLLEDPEVTVERKKIISEVLKYHGNFETGEAVLKIAMLSDDDELKIACIKTLGDLEFLDGVPFLLECLDSDNWICRSQAAKALGIIGWDEAVPQMTELLTNDDHYWVKLHSASAIKTSTPGWKKILKKIYSESNDEDTRQIIKYVWYEKENQ